MASSAFVSRQSSRQSSRQPTRQPPPIAQENQIEIIIHWTDNHTTREGPTKMEKSFVITRAQAALSNVFKGILEDQDEDEDEGGDVPEIPLYLDGIYRTNLPIISTAGNPMDEYVDWEAVVNSLIQYMEIVSPRNGGQSPDVLIWESIERPGFTINQTHEEVTVSAKTMREMLGEGSPFNGIIDNPKHLVPLLTLADYLDIPDLQQLTGRALASIFCQDKSEIEKAFPVLKLLETMTPEQKEAHDELLRELNPWKFNPLAARPVIPPVPVPQVQPMD